MRILGFLVMAALGYASVFLILALGLQTEILETLPADAYLPMFRTLYFGGGLIACILATGIGIMAFFCEGIPGRLLFWLPFYGPAVYCLAILAAYYS